MLDQWIMDSNLEIWTSTPDQQIILTWTLLFPPTIHLLQLAHLTTTTLSAHIPWCLYIPTDDHLTTTTSHWTVRYKYIYGKLIMKLRFRIEMYRVYIPSLTHSFPLFPTWANYKNPSYLNLSILLCVSINGSFKSDN